MLFEDLELLGTGGFLPVYRHVDDSTVFLRFVYRFNRGSVLGRIAESSHKPTLSASVADLRQTICLGMGESEETEVR